MELHKITGITPDKRGFQPASELVLSRFTGVEVELEGFSLSKSQLKKKLDPRVEVKKENSLRNNGWEFVFEQPMLGNDIIESLRSIESVCSTQPICLSERCSVHVHIDVRGWDTTKLHLLGLLYFLFETPIFNYAGPDRKNLAYCVPYNEAEYSLEFLSNLQSSNDHVVHGALKGLTKYSALNMEAALMYGSVEFRQHRGTTKANDIIAWINIIYRLIDAVENIGTLDFKYPQLFEKVFKEQAALLFYDGIEADISTSLRKLMPYLSKIVDANEFSKPYKMDSLFVDKFKTIGWEPEDTIFTPEMLSKVIQLIS